MELQTLTHNKKIICYNSYSANTKVYSTVGSLYDLQSFIISCYTTVASINTSQKMFLLIRPDEDQSVLRMSISTCRQKHNRNVFYLIYFAPVC